ncbi:SusC/RagA family TonB-linked outer membrane protein [Bacteroidia bacterium]|nr:SusC/RagA family TonB-linked outer membrane protein [Bacteroidia bacterium]
MRNAQKILAFAILLLGLLSSPAQAQSATRSGITIDVKNEQIKEVLKKITQSSDYKFFYDESVANDASKISLTLSNASLDAVLAELEKQTGFKFIVRDNTITVSSKSVAASVAAQATAPKQVSGTVVDENGEPVIGASVSVKGANIGTATDVDGKFSLNASPQAVLVTSYLGYKPQEITVGNQTSLNITLSENLQELEEVVVVGYGTQKKVNLTGAVASVKGEVLENRSVTNISQALQGQVANLNITSAATALSDRGGGSPGATQSINLRGYTGMGSSGSPLIVIDGIQGGDLNTINMNDVESITVLKDAASTAIYGSSAPFGVVLITTRKGKAGQKPTITYGNNFGFAQPINIPKWMNSLDYANFLNEACDNSGAAHQVTDEQLERIKDYLNGTLTSTTYRDPTPGTDRWMVGNANNDAFDVYLKKFAFNQQHNIGISGSAGKTNYYAGLAYLRQNGVFKYGDENFQRYNARVNLTSELTNWLDFSFRGAFSRRVLDDHYTYVDWYGNYLHTISAIAPWVPAIDPNGERSDAMIIWDDGGREKETTDNAVLSGEFTFHPLPGWDITANYAYDGTYLNSSQHWATLYHTLPSGTVAVVDGTTPSDFRRSFTNNQHHIINVFSSYEKEFNGHYFKVLGGFTQEVYDNLGLTAKNNYLYSDNIPSLAVTYGSATGIGESGSQLAIRGGFGRFNYNYKEKYLFEFDGRYDGTSRFLSDVRYKFYPGVSAAWVPSKESFWTPIEPVVNLMKIRATYGSLGDQSFTGYYPFYPSLNSVSPTSSNYMFASGRESYISNPGLINPALTWITTSTIDFGVDFAFLSNRLNVSFDWYRRYMDDFVGPAEVMPAFLGTSAPQANSTAMKTEGWELTIGWKQQTGDIHYGVNAVLSDYQGYITKYPNPNGLIGTYYEGQRIGEIWGYESEGLFQSEAEIAAAPSQARFYGRWLPGDVRYKDLDGNGVINPGNNTLDDPGDRKVIGNTTPRYSFGVTLNVEYKGFDFTAFFQGVGKRDATLLPANHNQAIYFWGITGWQNAGYTQHYDRWSESNPGGYYPRYYSVLAENAKNRQPSTRYLPNAAYMRVKNMQLGYSLPSSVLKHINCQKLRLFVDVENLATITKLIRTMDPEIVGINGYNGAADGKVYPLQRTWSCGLSVTF